MFFVSVNVNISSYVREIGHKSEAGRFDGNHVSMYTGIMETLPFRIRKW